VARTKVDEIVSILEDAIISGHFPPGTVLRQDRLSEELGVSRTPVREALRVVASFGLVSLELNHGARVQSLSPDEFKDNLAIRARLEALAARLAVDKMTKTELKALRSAQRRFAKTHRPMGEAERGELYTRWLTAERIAANAAFHDVILAAARSPLLERMAKSARRTFSADMSWPDSSTLDELYQASVADHEGIIDAFAASDPKVGELVSAHVLASMEILMHLSESGSQRRGLLRTSAVTGSRNSGIGDGAAMQDHRS
jgi:DNA-binding GntR family transcriptional regulator